MIDARQLEARNRRDRARRAQQAMHLPAPVGGILDPRFAYTPARSTDIRETFAKARAGQLFNLQPKKVQP